MKPEEYEDIKSIKEMVHNITVYLSGVEHKLDQLLATPVEQEPVLQRVEKVLRAQFLVDNKVINNDSRLIEDLGLDEWDVVELVMAIETEFNYEIPMDVENNWRTVGDVVEFTTKELKAYGVLL